MFHLAGLSQGDSNEEDPHPSDEVRVLKGGGERDRA